MTDPLQHPDLRHLARRLRDRLDETLDAEQHAAMSAARRRRNLRDHFLEAEDRAVVTHVATVDGETYRGCVEAVGADHVVLGDGATSRIVAIAHIITMEVRR